MELKFVMPGLVPGIHVSWQHTKKDVDGRDKPGHDGKANHFRWNRSTVRILYLRNGRPKGLFLAGNRRDFVGRNVHRHI
jgi:hypothetical protein